ncbi:MAG: asparaginase [Candidatus Subteraquimicrobiales bacterium]|nr:asparaginase [Candidatus Subteraquimicrobiales bacterium]
MDTRVALVKLTPNIHPEFFDGFKKYRGILIEGYGDGNIPSNLVYVLKRLARKRIVILASQCAYGKVSHKYEGGASLIQAGAISAEDMTKEMTFVKLMWALGQNKKLDGVRRILKKL